MNMSNEVKGETKLLWNFSPVLVIKIIVPLAQIESTQKEQEMLSEGNRA